MYTLPKYWLGTQESSDQIGAAVAQLAAAKPSYSANSDLRAEFGLPPLLSIQSGVGVITISGPLVPGPASGIILWGATGYDEIRQAVAEALNNPEVKSIMLHISSGGGAVSGVEDLGSFLKMAGKMKPMTTHADGVMASAAYWLGSYGSHISTSRTSILGSLGVLMVHLDRSEQLAQDGIKATVIRAGKYKALGNSVEPLSDVAKEELESQAQGIYDVFMGVVSANRDVTLSKADSEFGQGREFLGKDAVKVGLADAIMSYDQALMHAKSLDKSGKGANNPGKFKGASAMKVTLTSEQLAAIAAGSTLVELGFAEDAVLEPAGEKSDVAADTQPSPEMVALTEQVTALTAQAAEATAAAATAATEVATFKAQAEAATATHEGLLAIARAATGGILIRLGGSGQGAASMDAATVIAAHAQASETMNSRFRVGGVAKPVKVEDKVAEVSHRHQAIVSYGPQARQAAARK